MNHLAVGKIDFLLDRGYKKLQNPYLQSHFPLRQYGYIMEAPLNNENRWPAKIVCSIIDKQFKQYVSTTYAKKDDYLKLIETTTFLKCRNKLFPKIVNLYPYDNTVLCERIGEFLIDHLLNNPNDLVSSLISVFEYLKEINSINQSYKPFVIPSIVQVALELAKDSTYGFEFLPKTRISLLKLKHSINKFSYGCGIEDPHIWNFRVMRSFDRIEALSTDFDYFSNEVNPFWELGYFYATFRWFKKISFSLADEAEKNVLSLIQNQDVKSKFMFWLGVLSSYCGYKDSLRNLIMNGGITVLEEQYKIIKQLDEKVSYLAEELL